MINIFSFLFSHINFIENIGNYLRIAKTIKNTRFQLKMILKKLMEK